MADVLLTDIDGTLVGSNTLHAEAWRRTFEHFGIQIGMDEAWQQIGKGADQLIPKFVPRAIANGLRNPSRNSASRFFIATTCCGLLHFPKLANF
jgi:beta-phosphoglucomutase-like phosphatase (HAD superfamily)